MSNDQTTTNSSLTPIILVVSSAQEQAQAALEYINTQLKWNLSPNSTQLTYLNQSQEKISISMVRELIGELAFASHLGKNRAFVLLRSEQLSLAAQNALLKSLEEPPVKTQIILVTTTPNSLLETIRSRCLIKFDQNKDQSTEVETEPLPKTLEKLITDPNSISYTQIIDFTQKNKDKIAALILIKQLLFKITQLQKSAPTTRLTKLQLKLAQAHNYINHNVNLQLSLEDCFFAFKRT
jgi:hypothetical protein